MMIFERIERIRPTLIALSLIGACSSEEPTALEHRLIELETAVDCEASAEALTDDFGAGAELEACLVIPSASRTNCELILFSLEDDESYACPGTLSGATEQEAHCVPSVAALEDCVTS